MEMETYCANSMRDITDYINDNHIAKDQIVNIMQCGDGTFAVNYFV
jgi:hypothetical protein